MLKMELRHLALLTDFGERDYFVASVKAVALAINPYLNIIDITHNVPSFNFEAAGFILTACYRLFPAGTIFLAIVDPGVGSERKIIMVLTEKYYFLGPDNGILWPALQTQRVLDIREIKTKKYFLTPGRTTFEGRDRLAPAAAFLSLGLEPSEFGPSLTKIKSIPLAHPVIKKNLISGSVIYVDKFGNLITNIPKEIVADLIRNGKKFIIIIKDRVIKKFAKRYVDSVSGQPFGLINSLGFLEIALNMGSAAEELGAGPGTPVNVSII